MVDYNCKHYVILCIYHETKIVRLEMGLVLNIALIMGDSCRADWSRRGQISQYKLCSRWGVASIQCVLLYGAVD